jgi:hypothetical protein
MVHASLRLGQQPLFHQCAVYQTYLHVADGALRINEERRGVGRTW